MDWPRAQSRAGGSRGARAQRLLDSGRSAVSGADLERRYVEVVRQVKASVRIPVSIKLAPASLRCRTWQANWSEPARTVSCSSIASTHLISTADAARDQVAAAVDGRRAAARVDCPPIAPRYLLFAASRGVESEVEVVKYLPGGRRCRHDGFGPVAAWTATRRDDEDGLERWLFANGFDSVDAIRGLKDATHVEDVDALIRAQYVAALTDYLPGKLV